MVRRSQALVVAEKLPVSLGQIISHPVTCEIFKVVPHPPSHCVVNGLWQDTIAASHNQELLAFYLDVQLFKKVIRCQCSHSDSGIAQLKPEERPAAADDIVASYVQARSPFEINLAGQLREDTIRKARRFQHCNSASFDSITGQREQTKRDGVPVGGRRSHAPPEAQRFRALRGNRSLQSLRRAHQNH